MAEKRIVDIGPVLEELKADLLDYESCCEPLTLAEAMKDEIEDLEKLPIIDPEVLRPTAKWRHLLGDEWCCTHCGYVISTEGSWEKPTAKFCEECGAKMEGVTYD